MRRKAPNAHASTKGGAKPPPHIWNHWIFAGLLLVLLTFLAYQQIWHLRYIWDDNWYVTSNPTLRSADGLWRIWFDVAATPQYYPLVHSSFWLEYHLWGLNPAGYHAVNVLLHALAAVLLWRILLELGLPGAWWVAAIFALHPVQVESVAWISERKNVLSGVFYLAAAFAYLRFAAASKKASTQRFLYVACFALFVLALLSKTVACSLPVALLLVRWWKTGKVQRRDFLLLLPFFVTGFAFGLSTAWIEQHHVGAEGAAWSLSFGQRILMAGRAIWFYAAKLLWPAKLTFIYPRWDLNVTSIGQWAFPLAVVAVVLGLWTLRTKIGRGPLAAVLFFIITLGPALGFINVFPFRYSFVADHFQYLATIGIIALAVAGLNRLPRFVPALLLALLAALTWKQTSIYQDVATLWRDTVEKNPGSWMAQNNYGMVLIGMGKEEEGLAHLQQALALDPNTDETRNNLGVTLPETGRVKEWTSQPEAPALGPNDPAAQANLGSALLQTGLAREAIEQARKAIQLNPNEVAAYSTLGDALLQAGKVEESFAALQKALALDPDYLSARFNLANTLLRLHRADEAIAQLEQILQTSPDDAEAQKNIAWILATSPEARIRNGRKAVQLAESADKLTGGRNPIMGATLAAAYAETDRFSDAIKTAERALQIADDSGSVALGQALRAELAAYRSKHPFRDNRQ